jgi:hypothetical protein
MRAALSARVSTHDQHTLAMQRDALRECATRRHWTVADAVEEVASGATNHRLQRQALLKAATQRQLDVILVWKLDRWGRSLVDLMTTLRALIALVQRRGDARDDRPGSVPQPTVEQETRARCGRSTATRLLENLRSRYTRDAMTDVVRKTP